MLLPMRLNRRRVILLVCLALIAVVLAVPPLRHGARLALALVGHRLQRKATVGQRLEQYGPAARARLKPYFDRARIPYPPSELALVGLKQERLVQVVARRSGHWRFIRDYRIVAASGRVGPKLREGDGQVPEGLYAIDSLNANSLYHLALRVSYPNDFDRVWAQLDGRDKLGGNIMIHGRNGSVGCLAMGDETAEDLFVLAADTGIRHVRLILAPLDLRLHPAPCDRRLPPWTVGLYRQLGQELQALPAR